MPSFFGKPSAVILILLAACLAGAQKTTVTLLKPLPTYDPKKIHIYFSVEKDGHPVMGLKPDDLSIKINGQKAEVVGGGFGYDIAQNVPFGIALVMDKGAATSGVRTLANRFAQDLANQKDTGLIQAFTVEGSDAKPIGRSDKGAVFGETHLNLPHGTSSSPSDVVAAVQRAVKDGTSQEGDKDESDYKKARVAVFLIAVSKAAPSPTLKSAATNAQSAGVPIFVADFGGHNPELEKLASELPGAYESLPTTASAEELANLADKWVGQAKAAVSDEYSAVVRSDKAIGDYYTVEITDVQGGVPVATTSYSSYSRLMLILPLAAIAVAMVSMLVMALSWRRVTARLKDPRYNPRTGQIDGAAAPTAPLPGLAKVNHAADRVTAVLVRNRVKKTTDPEDWAWTDPKDDEKTTDPDWAFTGPKAGEKPDDAAWAWTAPLSTGPTGGDARKEPDEAAHDDQVRLAIVAQSGNLKGRPLALAGRMLLGREKADIQLDDPNASRRHAEINVSPGAPGNVTVVDLGSVNGTLVNDQTISAAVRLMPGDRLEIGETTFLVQALPSDADGTGRQPTGPHRKGASR